MLLFSNSKTSVKSHHRRMPWNATDGCSLLAPVTVIYRWFYIKLGGQNTAACLIERSGKINTRSMICVDVMSPTQIIVMSTVEPIGTSGDTSHRTLRLVAARVLVVLGSFMADIETDTPCRR